MLARPLRRGRGRGSFEFQVSSYELWTCPYPFFSVIRSMVLLTSSQLSIAFSMRS
jgi:hypothetical protein